MIYNKNRSAILILTMSTIAFTVCFACWIINAILVTFLVSNGVYSFSDAQMGWLLAVPILTGAISRVPLGLATDRFGGQFVFIVVMITTAAAMLLLSSVDSYVGFLYASLAFGIAGGSFAVGIGYISPWFSKNKQGTALGIFGMGNAGAAITTMLSPQLLNTLTQNGTTLDNWRQLPQIYAAVLVITAIIFYFLTENRVNTESKKKSLAEQFAPLKNVIVWRFGLYYFLVFGSFVALAQWIVPYSINVYEMTLVQAGVLATAFILPSGLIRVGGGWLSDYFGARTVMYGVFVSMLMACAILTVPKMEVTSPGAGILAKAAGEVTYVSDKKIVVNNREYYLTTPLKQTPSQLDNGSMLLPQVSHWHSPVVFIKDRVDSKQLLARGETNIYYPANFWLFFAMVLVLGIATGIGNAAVYKFIPDQFPSSVGAVGGLVGCIGALGGFFFPAVWGYLLQGTGLWVSCWVVLGVISLICLLWMHIVTRNIIKNEVPDLVQLIERRPSLSWPDGVPIKNSDDVLSVEKSLKQVPFLSGLTEEELKRLTKIGQTQKVKDNTIVFNEHDRGDSLYIILRGQVRIFRQGKEGQEIDLVTLGDQDFFGELALIDGKNRSTAASTLTQCDFFLIGRRDFLTLVSRSPYMLSNLLYGLSSTVRRLTDNFNRLALKERIRTEAEIQRHRSVSQMVAGVAHEINTPIGIVNHAASLINDNLKTLKLNKINHDSSLIHDLSDASNLIQKNIARANHLIQSFKNLSAHQASDQQQTIDIIELITEIVSLYKLKAQDAQLEINVINNTYTETNRQWHGFPGYFTQIILNLLSNVERYAYPNGSGSVEIILSHTNSHQFNVVVRDFGVGISEKNISRVFDPFYTTGRSKGGTGLGLAIVFNLVTNYLHGSIDVESIPGSKTQVIIRFPKHIPSVSVSKYSNTQIMEPNAS